MRRRARESPHPCAWASCRVRASHRRYTASLWPARDVDDDRAVRAEEPASEPTSHGRHRTSSSERCRWDEANETGATFRRATHRAAEALAGSVQPGSDVRGGQSRRRLAAARWLLAAIHCRLFRQAVAAADASEELVLSGGNANAWSPDLTSYTAGGSSSSDCDHIRPGRAVLVAAGDLDGDGRAEIITAPGPGTQPVVRTFRTAGNALAEVSSFYACDPAIRGGVFVAAPR